MPKVPHGHCRLGQRSRTYKSWESMKQRCLNPNSPNYRYYGGRGITVDPRWDSFENFLADMGERPEGLTLDRIDNDKGYGPDNCRWATMAEQHANQHHGGVGGPAKLTEADVCLIRSSTESQKALALRFGVSQPNISYIHSGRTWGQK